jgi:PAS domain S-box-containing protein
MGPREGNSEFPADVVSSRRRLAVIMAVGILGAVVLEMSGRALFLAWRAPYSVTGTLTMLAILAWGSASVYVISRLHTRRAVTGVVWAGAFLLAFSQAVSLADYFWVPPVGAILRADDMLRGILEEGSFLVGLAALFSGFYLAIFDSGRARIQLDLKHTALLRQIEDNQRAYRALAESEGKYRSLVESYPHAILIVKNGKIAFANPAAAATLRLPSVTRLIGADPFEFVAEGDRERLRGNMQARFQNSGNPPSTYRVMLRRSDGEEFPSMQYIRMITFEGQQAEQIVGVDLSDVHRAETALRAKSIAIETSVTAMAFSDMEGRLIEVNPAFLRLSGYDRAEEVLGKPATRFWEAPAEAPARLQYVLEHGSWEGETTGKRRDGSPFPVYVSICAARDQNGVPLCIMASCLDLTQQKMAQQELEQLNAELDDRVRSRTAEVVRAIKELRERSEQNDTVLRTAMDGFCLIARDGRFLDVNDSLGEITGYLRDSLLRMSLRDIEIAETREDIQQHVRDSIRQGSERLETRLRRSDGTEFDVEVSTTYLPGADVFFNFIRDITDRKRNEEALRLSEAKYRELVENANSIILRLTPDGNISFINEFAQTFFGYAEAELLGKNVVGTVVPEIDEEGRDLAAMMRDLLRRPDAYASNENENVLRNGERVWIAWTNKPIYDGGGALKEILCVGNDITPRVRAERLVTEQQAKMAHSARLSALGVMASGIAHEINNPLAIVSTGVEQLESLVEDPSRERERLETVIQIIRRNCERIQRIIRGLRGLSRDASRDPFVTAALESVITDTLELCRERFRTRGVDLQIVTPSDGCEIECRPSQLCQVLLNLLNNALDAVETLDHKWVKVEVASNGDRIQIAVTDSGTVLPRDMQEKLFVPFFTTKAEQKGMGLGLSISRAIVEAHQGEIMLNANSAYTRFEVHLPKRQPVRPDVCAG